MGSVHKIVAAVAVAVVVVVAMAVRMLVEGVDHTQPVELEHSLVAGMEGQTGHMLGEPAIGAAPDEAVEAVCCMTAVPAAVVAEQNVGAGLASALAEEVELVLCKTVVVAKVAAAFEALECTIAEMLAAFGMAVESPVEHKTAAVPGPVEHRTPAEQVVHTIVEPQTEAEWAEWAAQLQTAALAAALAAHTLVHKAGHTAGHKTGHRAVAHMMAAEQIPQSELTVDKRGHNSPAEGGEPPERTLQLELAVPAETAGNSPAVLAAAAAGTHTAPARAADWH